MELKTKTIVILVVSAIGLLGFLLSIGGFIEFVDAGDFVVNQTPSGELVVWTEPGPHVQWWGDVTVYKRSSQYDFSASSEKQQAAGVQDRSLKLRFKDNGSAHLSGSVSFDLPKDKEKLVSLHETFRSMEGIVSRLIENAVKRSIYLSGPLITSKESAGERRADLISLIQDQASIGIYKTERTTEQVEDLLAGVIEVPEKIEVPKKDAEGNPVLDGEGNPIMITKVVIIEKPRMKSKEVTKPLLKDGQYVVQEPSAIAEFGIRLYNWSIDGINYEDKVKTQIEDQRNALMQVETAMANAKRAEQDAITAEKQGQADATKEKWKQEKEKAREVTKAEQEKEVAIKRASQRKEVAQLNLEAAKLDAQAEVERGKGLAESQKLQMQADGALSMKLAAYKEVNKFWADNLGKHRIAPEIMMCGEGGGSGSNASLDFMRMINAKTVKDLSIDFGIRK